MSRKHETTNTGNTDFRLAARFRFDAVGTLIATREREQATTLPGRKIKIRTQEEVFPPECLCCGGEMAVYRRASGDEWAACPRCGYADDVPGYAALALRCTLREAIDFLIYQHNMHRVTETEIERYLENRARYDRFVACLQERLFVDYSLCTPCPEHGLNVIALEEQMDRLGLREWIGGTPQVTADLPSYAKHVEPLLEHQAATCDPRRADVPRLQRLPSQVRSDFFGFASYHAVESWFYCAGNKNLNMSGYSSVSPK